MARNTAPQQKPEKKVIMIRGRMINGSLFEKDQFDEKSTPSYKIEIAIDRDKAFDTFVDQVVEFLDEAGIPGELDIDNGKIISGIIDGDLIAKRRAEAGKPGDAYKGKWVLRAKTIYNKDGDDAAGGVRVYDENVDEITVVNRSAIYNGAMVEIGVTLDNYSDSRTGKDAVTYYLVAVQKVGDGERLSSPRDHSTMFKKVGRQAQAAQGETRRRRAG